MTVSFKNLTEDGILILWFFSFEKKKKILRYKFAVEILAKVIILEFHHRFHSTCVHHENIKRPI